MKVQHLFDGLLVGVGVLQAVILAFTIKAINKQSEAAKDSQRAWIIVDVVGEFSPKIFGDAVIWLVSPNVKNSGQTPARILKMALNLNPILAGGSLPPEPTYRKEHSWELIVPPGQSLKPLSEGVVKSDIDRVVSASDSLYLCGFIKYEDAWKRSRETRFCFRYHYFTRIDEPQSGFYLDPEVPEAYTRCTWRI
jgi:hypothetical protein